MSAVVEFKNISKDYYLFDKDYEVLKWLIGNKEAKNKKNVLDNISFSIYAGEIVGIIGRNGAGKSTIMNLIQKTTYPTSGEIIVNGSIGSFVNLGAGLFEEYSGRENVYYKSLLMGKEKESVDEVIDDIMEFADIGSYFDMPLKMFSSGMRARLGFAISIFINPDIILLDEIFAVGDKSFKQKSGQKMRELITSGKTVVLTSHNDKQIQQFCSRAIYIERGQILFDGKTDKAIEMYKKIDEQKNKGMYK